MELYFGEILANALPVAMDTDQPPISFLPLDTRVIRLWRISQIMRSLVYTGIFLAIGVALYSAEAMRGTTLLLFLPAFLLLRGFLLVWYPKRAYQCWGYRIDGKVLEIREGIWFKSITLLPLNRVQHVDLHSGPIERSQGLATLIFHTAGTHQAMITVPGLDAAEAGRLRDQLVVKGGDDGV
jgi:membrane protein YdbS with pleckstrin-like domain